VQIRTPKYDVEKVFARARQMFLLIGGVLLIASCAGYKEYPAMDPPGLYDFSSGNAEYQRTGQRSMLQDWRPQLDGAGP